MQWTILISFGVLFFVLREISQKYSLMRLDVDEALAYRGVWIIMLMLMLFSFLDWSAPQWTYWAAVGVGVAAAGGFYLQNIALKNIDISYLKPIAGVHPVFVSIIAFVFLHEHLHLVQVGGIVLIAIGIFFLEIRKKQKWYAPVQLLLANKYARITLVAVLILSITATGDRFILFSGMPIFTYLFVVWGTGSIVFISVFLFKKRARKFSVKGATYTFLPAAFTIISHVGFYGAIAVINAGIASAIFSTQALFSTIFGGLFFKEASLEKRIIASTIITLGGVVLLLL